MADKGGLSNLEGLSTSDDVLSNLQNEIANRQKQQMGDQHTWKSATSLGLLSGDANQITNAMNAREQNANSLFNMRQQLAQSQYLKGMSGNANQMFAGFDPDTAAALKAQYALDPSAALKAATELRSKNAELTGTQKENKAAGLSKADIYRKTLGADFDLDTFGKKEGIKSLFDLEKLGITNNQDLYKLGLTQGHDFDLANVKANLDFQKDKTLQELKYDKEYGGMTKGQFEQHKAEVTDVTKAAKDVSGNAQVFNRLQEILQNPAFKSGQLEGNFLSKFARQNLTPETAQLQDEFEGLSKQLVLPSAKQLGANPSDRDAKIIESTIGGITETKGAIMAKIARHEMSNQVVQEHQQFITNGGSEAEWSKKGGPGEQAWNKAIGEINQKWGIAPKANVAAPAKQGAAPAQQGQWKIIR
jgi:hypothetical protein